jgi:hypothetical protein
MQSIGPRDVRDHTCRPERPLDCLDRRRLIGLLGFGAASVLTGTSLAGRSVLAASGTEALLLNCIDYRLAAATTRYMTEHQMEGKYDQFILAGAALGVENHQFPDWGRTFWDHVKVAIDLHHIRRIVVMDHRDCGFYKGIHGKDLAAEPEEELKVHAAQMHVLKADIARRHPELSVELLLMGLDGKAETVA